MEWISSLISLGQGLPVEMMWGVMLVASFGFMLLLQFLFGKAGLFLAIVLAVIGANVQVLKVVSFGIMGGEPVALGTILFTTTYLATDILCERYGRAAAFQGVMMGFFGFLAWTIWMNITIAFQPYIPKGDEVFQAHDQIATIFTIFPQFFIASMVAFLVSETLDVWLFDTLRKRMEGRALWLRNNCSTVVSALVDNTVFSLLAWIVLADSPLPLQTVIVTYILGTFVLRVIAAVLDTPMVYVGKHLGTLTD